MTASPSVGSEGPPSKGGEAIDAWIRFYEDKKNVPESVSLSDKLSRYSLSFFSRIERELKLRLHPDRPIRVWSAGSGIDHISLMMKAKYGPSVDITILDVSNDCIAANQRAFEAHNLSASFVVGDLFRTQYSSEFDIVFNTGLLEHFGKSEQEDLLRTFSNSLVPGGEYLTYVPYAGGRLANHCRNRMMARKVWPYGPEVPISTFKDHDCGGLTLIEEAPMDALDQLNFIRPAYPLLGTVMAPALKLASKVPKFSEPAMMKVFGGYGLYARFEKSPSA